MNYDLKYALTLRTCYKEHRNKVCGLNYDVIEDRWLPAKVMRMGASVERLCVLNPKPYLLGYTVSCRLGLL